MIKNLAAESRVRLLLLNANPETHYNIHVLLIIERNLLLTARINIFILQLQPKTKGEFRFPVFVHWHHKQVTFITANGSVMFHDCESMNTVWLVKQ